VDFRFWIWILDSKLQFKDSRLPRHDSLTATPMVTYVIKALGGHIACQHWLYDTNMPTKLQNRCCSLLGFTSQLISCWYFT
jgi:hypothetical protein